MKTGPAIAATIGVVFVVGIAAQSGSKPAPSHGDPYALVNAFSTVWPTAPQPPGPQLPTPRVQAPKPPSYAFKQPKWVNKWAEGDDNSTTTNGLPVPKTTSSSGSSTSTTGHNAVQTKCARNEITAATCKRDGYSGGYGSPAPASTPANTMAKRRSATYRRSAQALAMIQTKCQRGEMLAATCKRDGFPGGR